MSAPASPKALETSSGGELERTLDFTEHLMREFSDCLGVPAPREIPMMVQLVRSHLAGNLETPSSLIEASGMPRGTAHRTLQAMVEAGLVQRRPRTPSGKTYSLHPSDALIERWFDYERRVKSAFGNAFGSDGQSSYFYGGSYLAASAIPPLPALFRKLDLKEGLRLLLHADPAFLAMKKVKRQFELHFGTRIDVRALSIDRLRREILANAERQTSQFDIVTCDVCWMAELIERGVLRSLGRNGRPSDAELRDFHPAALATAEREGEIYGLPVQTTPELLVYRRDLFSRAGLSSPKTPYDLLKAARELHSPGEGVSGIAWNGARGTPVGTTFMMLMADFGQPVLNLPHRNGTYSDRALAPENFRPALDTPTALETAEFLVELLNYSPDTVLQMSWFERAECFARGGAAMAYCYTQIMPMFEDFSDSPAFEQIGFALHPSAEGVPQMAPLGGWNLCIPANLPPGRAAEVELAVRSLTSPEAIKIYIENGSLVTSRFSVCNDPAVSKSRPVIPVVDRISRAGQIQSWSRPAVAELNDLVGLLGEEIHMMLLRNKKPRAALRDAQARADRLMRESGRY